MSDDSISIRQLPSYRDLPVAGQPASSAWSVFGSTDQVGTINLLTPEQVLTGAALVRKGTVFSLNWELEKPDPPILSRGALRHHINKVADGTDDYYDNFYPQGSSQWDSLCHIAHPAHGFYNGCTLDEITGLPGSRNGIDNWARRGIVGRFVLVDVERHRIRSGSPIAQDTYTPITVAEIDAAMDQQGVTLSSGDILLLRFGWLAWYAAADTETRARLAEPPYYFPTPGLAREERTAEWLWDHRVAAVAADNPAVEAMPVDVSGVEGFLHYRLIPLLGMALGEMFALDVLADDCSRDGVYEGLFTAAPLNKVGGSGSPANALAIK